MNAIQKLSSELTDYCLTNIELTAQEFGGSFSKAVQSFIRNNGILPYGTRYVEEDAKTKILVIEQPPTVRNINIRDKHYSLSFPYMVFGLVLIRRNKRWYYEQLAATCRTKPLSSLEDMLYHVPLPNIDNDGWVCLGNNIATVKKDHDYYIEKFWQTVFTEYHSVVNFDIDEWQEKSKRNSLFILKHKFRQHKKLADVIEFLKSLGEGEGESIFEDTIQEIYEEVWRNVLAESKDGFNSEIAEHIAKLFNSKRKKS